MEHSLRAFEQHRELVLKWLKDQERNWSSSVPRLPALPASGATTTMMCWRKASLSAASSRVAHSTDAAELRERSCPRSGSDEYEQSNHAQSGEQYC